MNHKVTLFLLAAAALICSNLAEAQQPKKISRIGLLLTGDPTSRLLKNSWFGKFFHSENHRVC
jgi:hypothetical protein